MSALERDPYGVPTDILASHKYTETVGLPTEAIGDAQAELIRLHERGLHDSGQYFTLLGISRKPLSEGTVVETVLVINGNLIITRAEGKTQADALTKAMKNGLRKAYPAVTNLELTQERVDVKGDVGSQIEAKLTFTNEDNKWKSIVVRDRRREAVEQAVTDAFEYTLAKHNNNLDNKI